MKLLFDQNISPRLIFLIQDILPEAKQVRQINLENSSDKQIWEYAKEHDFTIVTFDGDFYDFSLVWGHPPKIVWIRSYNQTTKIVDEILRKHFNTLLDFQDDKELACLELININ
jgi:predicted nuclease of predicted toxin-antitoxin system